MAYIGFKALESKLGARPGVTNPGALAASIGRKKYGAQKFNRYVSAGKSMRRAATLSSMKGGS